MAELDTMKLDPEAHVMLDEPLIRLPHELLKNNLKIAQQKCDLAKKRTTESLDRAVNGFFVDERAPAVLTNIDQALNTLNTLKQRLTALNESNKSLIRKSDARISHLEELYGFRSLADVKYEEWSRIRLDRMLADNMLRQGFIESAKELAAEKHISDLVDVEIFEGVNRIEKSLRVDKKVDLALAWCADNKSNLKKLQVKNRSEYVRLESELRLQQFIELVRSGETSKLLEAIKHAHKYLSPQDDADGGVRAAGLLAFTPDIIGEEHQALFSASRWDHLAELFVETHHSLFGLPQEPTLYNALRAGLSALKTPACHSKTISPSSGLGIASPNPLQDSDVLMAQDGEGGGNTEEHHHDDALVSSSLATSVCPICSPELNEIARNVPYANHSKSHVELDPVVLPNGRIYGRDRLMKWNERFRTPSGLVRDPVEPTKMFKEDEIRRVFIT